MDLVGKVFGNLTVMEQYGIYKNENLWLCRCDCGNRQVALHNRLTNGSITNCGCKRRGRKRADITGQRFGRLVAQEYLFDNHRNQACWLFLCDCGNEKILLAASVQSGSTQSCGCIRSERTRKIHLTDLSGQRFGRLTAVKPTDDRDATGSVVWECRCDCGNMTRYSVAALQKGSVKSCGCYYKDSRSSCDQYRKDKIEDTNLSQLVASKTTRSNNSSGNTGICYLEKNGKWEAYISFQKKRYYLGLFSKKEDAIKARKKAEEHLHDPVIRQNMERLTETSRKHFNDYFTRR